MRSISSKYVDSAGVSFCALYRASSRREEALYNAQNETPALSTYFELMDRIVPDFLGTLSTQKIKGTRVLLK